MADKPNFQSTRNSQGLAESLQQMEDLHNCLSVHNLVGISRISTLHAAVIAIKQLEANLHERTSGNRVFERACEAD